MSDLIRIVAAVCVGFAVAYATIVLAVYFRRRTSEGRMKWHVLLLAASWILFAMTVAAEVLLRMGETIVFRTPTALAGSILAIVGLHIFMHRMHDPIAEQLAQAGPWLLVDLVTHEILGAAQLVELLFGYERGELTGMHVHDLVPDRLRIRHREYVTEYAKNPRSRRMGAAIPILTGLRKNGSEFTVAIVLHPLHVGGRNCAVATVLDASVPR